MIDFDHGVELDRIRRDELPKLREWRNDWEIWKWCRQHDLIDEQRHVAWFERQSADPSISMFAIRSGLGALLGVCGLTSIDLTNRHAEFSLYIGPEHQRRGHAKAALLTLFDHGFLNLNLNLIWGETFEGNPAASLFEKIGMQKEGVRRQFYYRNGRYLDATLFSVTRAEWEEK